MRYRRPTPSGGPPANLWAFHSPFIIHHSLFRLPPPVGPSITDVNGSEVLRLLCPPIVTPLLETAPLGYIADGLTSYISKWLDVASPVTFTVTRSVVLRTLPFKV
jgi:hypothetical protein